MQHRKLDIAYDQNLPAYPQPFLNRILDFLVHRQNKSYAPMAFRKLWTNPGV